MHMERVRQLAARVPRQDQRWLVCVAVVTMALLASQWQLLMLREDMRGLRELLALSLHHTASVDRTAAQSAARLQALSAELDRMNAHVLSASTSLEQARRARQELRSLRQKAQADLYSIAQQGIVPHEDQRTAEPPCLMTLTTTTPQFRVCTLDPQGSHADSKSLHDQGHLTFSRTGALDLLLKLHSANAGERPLVVEVGAGIGFFSLQAASLGARVVALEPQHALASLLRTSAALNRFDVTVLQRGVGPSAALDLLRHEHGAAAPQAQVMRVQTLDDALLEVLGTLQQVHVLRVASHGDVMQELLSQKKITFVLLEFAPPLLRQRGADPLEVLGMLHKAGFNVFDDRNADRGAMQPNEFAAFVAALGDRSATVLAALAS